MGPANGPYSKNSCQGILGRLGYQRPQQQQEACNMDEVKKLLKGHPNLSIEENEDGKCKVYNFNISFNIRLYVDVVSYTIYCEIWRF
jgi:hypothetical protein